MLTLVGDPATFLVGSSIGMTFGQYLQKVSLGGVIAILVLIAMTPIIMKDIWQAQCTLPDNLQSRAHFAARPCAVFALVLVDGGHVPHRGAHAHAACSPWRGHHSGIALRCWSCIPQKSNL